MIQIKICGLTKEIEAEYLNEANVDYAGFIQFFPKSRRNISLEKAVSIKRELMPSVKSVAVTVSPSPEQIRQIADAGFDYIQIHGHLDVETLSLISIPVIKAFNVHDLASLSCYDKSPQIAGFVFDAAAPGSGMTFDWSLVPQLPASSRFALLAGGLNPENVVSAIRATGAKGVDTSSGVENDLQNGKSREKIIQFVNAVRTL